MMRSLRCCYLITLCVCVLVFAVEGTIVFKVGDEFGWRVPLQNDTAVYNRWASNNRFHIGDSLLFVYEKDSVMEVDKGGFDHCNGSDSITTFDNGNSTFNLDRSGFFYFISGSNEHCTKGQRLIVEVMHIHHDHEHEDDHRGKVSVAPSMPPVSASPLVSPFDSPLVSPLDSPLASAASSLIPWPLSCFSLLLFFFLLFSSANHSY